MRTLPDESVIFRFFAGTATATETESMEGYLAEHEEERRFLCRLLDTQTDPARDRMPESWLKRIERMATAS